MRTSKRRTLPSTLPATMSVPWQAMDVTLSYTRSMSVSKVCFKTDCNVGAIASDGCQAIPHIWGLGMLWGLGMMWSLGRMHQPRGHERGRRKARKVMVHAATLCVIQTGGSLVATVAQSALTPSWKRQRREAGAFGSKAISHVLPFKSTDTCMP